LSFIIIRMSLIWILTKQMPNISISKSFFHIISKDSFFRNNNISICISGII
jgi:hypothetical protein